MAILVAGVGNLLKGDDGFGIKALAAFRRHAQDRDVVCLETGIGGIHLVQELMRGYDAVVLFDAVDRGETPGRVTVLEPVLPDMDELSEAERRDYFSETHYATPIRALTFAREVGALPAVVRIIGCQMANPDAFGLGMHPAVEAAVPEAVRVASALVIELLKQVGARAATG
jgi:hydrogenase maturation protease